ncbi:MAG: TIGR03936 family radical SAM-associated protein [Clostridiaceae bacterium]|nr:TIGR03936 family radical SAM-associated protein [Clostridiaceae bacterium]
MNTNLRLRYGRQEPAVWLAHLDMMRTFERSVRRAGLPVAYSQGYNPRPQLSFALPIGVGLATLDDYVDVMMTEPVDAKTAIQQLNRNLPKGLFIMDAQPVPEEGPSLMSLIAAADYEIRGEGLTEAIGVLLSLPPDTAWPAEKFSKGKKIDVDIRPLIMSMDLQAPNIIKIRVKAGSRENLRPDLLLQLLMRRCGLDPVMAGDAEITRLALWIRPTPDANLRRPFDLAAPLTVH